MIQEIIAIIGNYSEKISGILLPLFMFLHPNSIFFWIWYRPDMTRFVIHYMWGNLIKKCTVQHIIYITKIFWNLQPSELSKVSKPSGQLPRAVFLGSAADCLWLLVTIWRLLGVASVTRTVPVAASGHHGDAEEIWGEFSFFLEVAFAFQYFK